MEYFNADELPMLSELFRRFPTARLCHFRTFQRPRDYTISWIESWKSKYSRLNSKNDFNILNFIKNLDLFDIHFRFYKNCMKEQLDISAQLDLSSSQTSFTIRSFRFNLISPCTRFLPPQKSLRFLSLSSVTHDERNADIGRDLASPFHAKQKV